MKWRDLARDANGRTAVLVFEHGDQVMPVLKKWCTEQQIPVDEQVEVLSLAGDVARGDGEPAVHGHIVVGRRDGSTRGGHFVDGTVRPTLELVVQETPAYLQKRHDPESGLALIDPEADQ